MRYLFIFLCSLCFFSCKKEPIVLENMLGNYSCNTVLVPGKMERLNGTYFDNVEIILISTTECIWKNGIFSADTFSYYVSNRDLIFGNNETACVNFNADGFQFEFLETCRVNCITDDDGDGVDDSSGNQVGDNIDVKVTYDFERQ
jgi:hypothetical protein